MIQTESIISIDKIQTLIRLGLTSDQSRVYLGLTKLGKASVKDLAVFLRMDRSNVYKVVHTLLKLALVEKIISSPSLFQPVPPKLAISHLLEKNKIAFQALEQRTKDLLEDQEISQQPVDFNSIFHLVPPGPATFRRIKELNLRSEKEHKILIYWKNLFFYPIEEIVELWQTSKKRGVGLKILVYSLKGDVLPDAVYTLGQRFSFKFISIQNPTCTISIYDNKEALVWVSTENQVPSLWARNELFVSVFVDYFEVLWEKAKIPPLKIA